jgi:glycosyltransferase involved in cell wall biosynthesis
MRINFLLPPVGMSGGIRVVALYAKWLEDHGHEVVLISQPRPAPALRQKITSAIKGKGWPSGPEPLPSHLDGLGLDHRVLDSHRPPGDADVPDGDVLIATWWETAHWAYALDKSKGVKTHFIQHHEVFPYLPLDSVHEAYRLPMHKIVVANWLKDVMRDMYGDPICDVVPNSVDKEQFHATPRAKQALPTVGFLYHEMPFKGLDVTLAVVDRLRRVIPDLRVLCFGASPPSRENPRMKGVKFFLSPPQAAIRNIYAHCDVWLTCSRTEGFNLPAMEAMACRTPVVSTPAGWPAEAVRDGYNGALADVDDVNGLARGVWRILSLDEATWGLYSQNAYATVEKSSWDQSARMFEEALVNARRRARRKERNANGRS